ncbi:MAG: dephospho-CoA kinase, partial [Microbacteriaceae bacterium]
DQVARDVVEPGQPALSEIEAHFGSVVINVDGSLDRVALGNRVFQNAEELNALNSIVHPRVRAKTQELFSEAAAQGISVVVYDIPLLVESGHRYPFSLVVTVEAGVERQQERLVQLRGFSAEHALARINAQATEEQRRSIADIVIDSSTTVAATIEQTEALWEQIQTILQAEEQNSDK